MAEYRRQTVIASAVAIAIALSVGLGVYYLQAPRGGITTGSSPAVGPGSIGSHPAILTGEIAPNSNLGLQLSLTISSSTYAPGQMVPINITETNTLSTVNKVSSQRNWPVSGLTLGPCGSLNYPFGIEIFPGYYDQSNISQASNQSVLPFYKPGLYPCPAILIFSSYSFQPLSDVANVSFGSMNLTTVVETNGSWTGSMSSSAFQTFNPGVYTIVAGDEWGDLAIVHFSVSTQLNQSITVGPTAIMPTGQSVGSSSGSSIERIFPFSSIPPNFTLGEYSFGFSIEGMHSGPTSASNGTTSIIEYLGDYATFYISNSSTTESTTFSWSPNVNMSTTLPEPPAASLFNGNVVLNFNVNATGSFVTIAVEQ